MPGTYPPTSMITSTLHSWPTVTLPDRAAPGKIVHRCGAVLIHNPIAGAGRDPSNQPPEHAATISGTDTVNTAGPQARRRPDLRHRVRGRAAGRHQPIQVTTTGHPAFQPRERHPDRLGVRGEAPQPAPHGRGRTAHHLGDPPPARPGRTGQQRSPDHRHHIHPAPQQRPGQQHVRAPAPGRSRADPPPRTDPPHQLRGRPHEPRCPMPPRRQPTPATRARQLTRDQHTFDHDGIRTYAEQRRPPGTLERPFPAAGQSEREGPLAFQDPGTLFRPCPP